MLLLLLGGEISSETRKKKKFAGIGETESSRVSVYIMVPRDGLRYGDNVLICWFFYANPHVRIRRRNSASQLGQAAHGEFRVLKITLKMGTVTERLRSCGVFARDCSVENNACIAAAQVSRPGHGESCLRAVCGGAQGLAAGDSQGRSSGASQWPHLGSYTIHNIDRARIQ